MITTVVVDDDEAAIHTLLHFLQNESHRVDIVRTFTSAKEAIRYLKSNRVDLVFLDIHLQEMTGFDLLDALTTTKPLVIITSGYHEYGIQAIKNTAIDYLTKPLDQDSVHLALNQVEKRLAELRTLKTASFLSNQAMEKPDSLNRIAIHTLAEHTFVRLSDIIRIESDYNSTQFVLKNGSVILSSRCLKNYESILPENVFLRVHQSHLVNIYFISGFDPEDGGSLILDNGDRVYIARRRKEEILGILSTLYPGVERMKKMSARKHSFTR
ncbi:MAG: hypothetical protein RL226_2033 [Bacteroidota bacterium]|jgi:two-component system LytT family response regulator